MKFTLFPDKGPHTVGLGAALPSGMVRAQTWQSRQEASRRPGHTDIAHTPGRQPLGDANICFGAKWEDVFSYQKR